MSLKTELAYIYISLRFGVLLKRSAFHLINLLEKVIIGFSIASEMYSRRCGDQSSNKLAWFHQVEHTELERLKVAAVRSMLSRMK